LVWQRITVSGIQGKAEFVQAANSGSSYESSAFCITNDGNLWATGPNSKGQFGLGNTAALTTWTAITTQGLAGKVQFAKIIGCDSDRSSAYALTADHDLWVTGDNGRGQLGSGSTAQLTTWTKITTPGLAGKVQSISVEAFDQIGNSAYCVTVDGFLWVTGSNAGGELGNGQSGTGNYLSTWTIIDTDAFHGNVAFVSSTVTQVTAGDGNSNIALKSAYCVTKEGDLFVTGNNGKGQLGSGGAAQVSTWTRIEVAGLSGKVRVPELFYSPSKSSSIRTGFCRQFPHITMLLLSIFVRALSLSG
jgi:alpha-tubulin suppressor-like RCC1 family protein